MKCPKCRSENFETKQFCGDCGTRLPEPDAGQPVFTKTLEMPRKELATGSLFAGRYQIIEELGKGGMGKVYQVLDTKLQEEVALKLIRPEIASDDKTLERFKNELKLARKISQKNVGRMFDMGEETGTPLHHHGIRPRRGPEELDPAVRPAADRKIRRRSPSRSARACPKPTASASSTATSSPPTS
ncbi:MAG: inactive serine/threonine-protein kinase VRK3 [Marinilabiliales bacterium]|nr:inactive serine/threonine-protein kinase VRK3 [Marinilabiliales bacterium]